MRLGDLDEALRMIKDSRTGNPFVGNVTTRVWEMAHDSAISCVTACPSIDAVPVTEAELKHLINDTVAYIWRLEDRGCDKPEFGYDSRKALLEKLKQFYKEHFPENGCCYGERKDGEG